VPNITLHGTPLGISLRTTQKVSSAGIAPITTATSYRAINGLVIGSASFGRQSLSIATRRSATTGIATQTSIAPDGTKTLTTTTHGLLTSSSSLNTANLPLATSTSTYNSLQQLETSTDSRTGTTTYSDFTESGQALTTTTPAGEITTTTLDRHGRPTAVKLPNNTFTYTSYHLSGQPAGKWGSLTNPTFTLYDDQGRMSELRTFQTLTGEPTAASPGSAKTTWQYSPTTGHLISKKDHENKGATYTHTPAGRLATRTWARSSVATPKVTEYTYTQGLMTLTDYSDTTPDVSMEYDALGRISSETSLVSSVSQSSVSYTYNPTTLALDTETISYNLDATAGYEFTRVLDRSQDSLLRDSGWTLGTPTPSSAIENSVSYAFGATDGRLASVNKGSDSFSYLYAPSSSLIATVTSPAHIVSNVYEPTRNVLASKVNKKLDTTAVSSYFYTVNNLGQRTNLTTSYNLGAGVTGNSGDVAWGYDSLGQVTSADHSADTAFNRSYQYDLIGNRLQGSAGVSPATTTTYTPNALNQYSQITNNSITNNPAFDADGNMTSGPLPANVDANSTLIWDGENRLIEAQVAGTSVSLVRYVYDSQSRRIAETVGSNTKITVYDGWNPIAEYWRAGLQPASLAKSFTWGIDLSGTLQGAGGVGGLLMTSLITNNSITSNYFPTYDGNGNVSEYLNESGEVSAHYEYDPFGKTTVATGPKANDFAHRFSTKPLDLTTGLYYYGYRFYDPETGRWPSRDPIEEMGGLNLYGFVGNDGVNRWDLLGLASVQITMTCNDYCSDEPRKFDKENPSVKEIRTFLLSSPKDCKIKIMEINGHGSLEAIEINESEKLEMLLTSHGDGSETFDFTWGDNNDDFVADVGKYTDDKSVINLDGCLTGCEGGVGLDLVGIGSDNNLAKELSRKVKGTVTGFAGFGLGNAPKPFVKSPSCVVGLRRSYVNGETPEVTQPDGDFPFGY
jgi:RHS repeat-associated protein